MTSVLPLAHFSLGKEEGKDILARKYLLSTSFAQLCLN